MNTILKARENKSENAINGIRLLINSPQKKVIIIVEGISDIKVYKKFFREENTFFCPIYNCRNIPLIYAHFKDSLKKFIVIRDADFYNIKPVKLLKYDNQFFTDTHDCETMLITKNSENKILSEFLISNNIKLFDTVLNDIENWSFIKYWNFIKPPRDKIDFCKYKSTSVYDGKSKISLSDCFDCINKIPKNHKGIAICKKEIHKFISNNKNIDKLQLTTGHDFINALVLKLKNTKNELGQLTQKITTEQIESILRTSYRYKDFSATKLYSNIESWGKNNKIKFF